MNLRPLLATTAALIVAGCVSIKSTDQDQLPAAWRQALGGKPTALGVGSSVFAGYGESIHSDGKFAGMMLTQVFFPGQRIQSDRCTLLLNSSGQLTVTATNGSGVTATATFDTELDRDAGTLLVKSIPVKDLNEFGRVLSTQSAHLQIGTDRALYAQVRQTGAGIVLFVPVAGTSSVWARWDAAPP